MGITRVRDALRKFEFSATAILLPAVIYFLNAGYFIILTFVAVFAHELGHYIAVRLCGGEVSRVRLSLTGASMSYSGLSYGGEVIAGLSGPGASVALAVAASLCGRVFDFEPSTHLAGLSLLLGVFNLLPAFPLDGGRALFGAVAHLFGLRAAEVTRKITSAALIAALLVLGAYLVIKTRNPTLALAAVWLAGSYLRPKKYAS
ncbi:MAG: site-2 protease family protein [Oscillospiraceae bacterium]|jgi:stage IV sporulation protein FB|nr:site-2 protease family protein [Oscillospiraceae bacterium]